MCGGIAASRRLKALGRLSLVVGLSVCAAGCALARSEVKSLRDADAARIAFDAPILTTVTGLNNLARHCGPAGNRRRVPEELRVYEVIGKVTRVRRERDRDIHIVLADLVHAKDRLVIELGDPDTKHARTSPYRDRLAGAQRMFDELRTQSGAGSLQELEGGTIRVTGVAFFDVNHFQRGRSRSCVELHPVLSIASVSQ